MRIRHVFIVSLGLNLLLGTFLLVRQAGQADESKPVRPVKVVRETVVEVMTNPPTANVSMEVSARSFQWSRLESEDYSTYVANLRAAGCPERTIQHIILEDIEKLYREKERSEPAPDYAWLTGPERDAKQLERKKREEARFLEKAQAIKLLLGRELDWEARKLWVNENEAAWFLSFITDDQAEQTMAIGHRLGQRLERTLGMGMIVMEEDILEAEGIYAEMRREFAKIGTPDQIEEALLRATLGINFGIIGDGELEKLSLSPEELRKVVSLQLREEDPFMKMMRMTGNGMNNPVSVYTPAFLNDVRQLLGEQRYTDFLCSQDEELNSLRTAVTQSGGSIETVSKVFEVQQLTLQEAESIRSDPNLTRAQKRADLRALQQTTKEAILNMGSREALNGYVAQGVSWLSRLERL